MELLKKIIEKGISFAEEQRSFSALKRIKSYLRSTMGQEPLNGLATLNINYDIARKLDYSLIIKEFANVKARKAFLN